MNRSRPELVLRPTLCAIQRHCLNSSPDQNLLFYQNKVTVPSIQSLSAVYFHFCEEEKRASDIGKLLPTNYAYNDLTVNNVTVKYLCHSSVIIRHYLNQENSRKLAINKRMLKFMYLILESMLS